MKCPDALQMISVRRRNYDDVERTTVTSLSCGAEGVKQ